MGDSAPAAGAATSILSEHLGSTVLSFIILAVFLGWLGWQWHHRRDESAGPEKLLRHAFHPFHRLVDSDPPEELQDIRTDSGDQAEAPAVASPEPQRANGHSTFKSHSGFAVADALTEVYVEAAAATPAAAPAAEPAAAPAASWSIAPAAAPAMAPAGAPAAAPSAADPEAATGSADEPGIVVPTLDTSGVEIGEDEAGGESEAGGEGATAAGAPSDAPPVPPPLPPRPKPATLETDRWERRDEPTMLPPGTPPRRAPSTRSFSPRSRT